MKSSSAQPNYERGEHFLMRNVEILLKDNNIINGVIISYCKEDNEYNAPITKWHIVDVQDKMTLGIDAFGFLIGSIIQHKDIQHIKCID